MRQLPTSLATLILIAASLEAQVGQFDPASSLERAGANRGEIAKAWSGVPDGQRKSLAFLFAGMPDRDLRSLDATFLLENVALAHAVREKVPWGRSIPEDRFLNDVLPYANLSEARDPWRRELMELCLPLVAECRTPGEAAQRLNRELFSRVGVKYSTRRKRADQSPKESMASGLASCTGLSILLVNACRAVAVPARVAGIASWVNKRGNHTWVEIWDDGWHFTGAAEPTDEGLDRTWFQADAALARPGDARHAIWAATWQRTNHVFPMAWAPERRDVFAVDVTSRYVGKADPAKARLLVRVREDGRRVATEVTVRAANADGRELEGESRGEGADTNDILSFDVPRGSAWHIRAQRGERRAETTVTLDGESQRIVDLELPAADGFDAVIRRWFAADAEARAKLGFPPALQQALRERPRELRRRAWKLWRASPHHADLRKDAGANRVRTADREAPYTLKRVGKKPATGWPLFIAMHGGGGVPKRVNDSQWRHMQIYYRDQADLGGYLYCALRAPNDVWDGFYDDAISPLVIRLIRQLVVTQEVDPERVHAMGYSHGGYGAFVIGPRIADRFATVHASAAAPTDGRTRAENLRNLRFSFMVGEKDTAYGRADRCRAFDALLRRLRGEEKSAFPTRFDFIEGNGHTGLPDRDQIRRMYAHRRPPPPRALSWRPSDAVLRDFYWLHVPAPEAGQELEARLDGRTLQLRTKGVSELSLRFDERLLSPAGELEIEVGGRTLTRTLRPDLRTMLTSMDARGDPGLAATMTIDLQLDP